jgi:hypothetical protein
MSRHAYRPDPETDQVEQSQQETANWLQLEGRLTKASPAKPQDAPGPRLVHKTLEARLQDLDVSKEMHRLSEKRGEGGGKPIPEMSQHAVEGIAHEQTTGQPLEGELPGRVIVPKIAWVLKEFGMGPAAGNKEKLWPDKLVVSQEYTGWSEDALKGAAKEVGPQVFDQLMDDKAFRFRGLKSKLDHVQLHEELANRLERVRRGDLSPAQVVNTDKDGGLLEAALKYENFPGLKPDAPIVLNVPRDVYSRTCYVENDQVRNRIEDHVRRRAKEHGFVDPERIRIAPGDKTTREIGALARFGREGLDLSPDEAQAMTGRINDLLREYEATGDPAALNELQRQMVEPRVAWNMGVGKDGVFVVDRQGGTYPLYRPEALPPEAREHVGWLMGDVQSQDTGQYVPFTEAHAAAQELKPLLKPVVEEGRPPTDDELNQMRGIIRSGRGEFGRDERGFYVVDSDGYRHRVCDFPDNRGSGPFHRVYVKA